MYENIPIKSALINMLFDIIEACKSSPYLQFYICEALIF